MFFLLLILFPYIKSYFFNCIQKAEHLFKLAIRKCRCGYGLWAPEGFNIPSHAVYYLIWEPVHSSLSHCWPVLAVTVWWGHDKVITLPPRPGSLWKSLLPTDFTTSSCHHFLFGTSLLPVNPSAGCLSVGREICIYGHIWMWYWRSRPPSRIFFFVVKNEWL